jgi:ribosomal-protein-alanine N-acetyltransferase
MSAYSTIHDLEERLYARPPRLDTLRLILRPINMGDAEAVFHICRDPRTVQFVSLELQKSIDDAKQLLESFRERRRNKKLMVWGIFLRETGQLIGLISVTEWNTKLASAEIGGIHDLRLYSITRREITKA